MSMHAPSALYDTILNLTRYHREHEKHYAQAPLEDAVELHRASRTLTTLADRFSTAEPSTEQVRNPYAGCEDLNETATIQEHGVLFMEGGGEPAELTRLKRDLAALADDAVVTGEWLAEAMESSWESARALLANPGLADLLGERHRIIASDWQNASTSVLCGRLLRRALEILEHVDLAPAAVRADLAGARAYPAYLYSAAELVDRAADLTAASSTLVHENERRWRVFRARVAELAAPVDEAPVPMD
jgi:hypothetical protein